jgi:hypothetical protein
MRRYDVATIGIGALLVGLWALAATLDRAPVSGASAYDAERAATCRILHRIATNRRERELAVLGCRQGVDPDTWLPTYEGTSCALQIWQARHPRTATRR